MASLPSVEPLQGSLGVLFEHGSDAVVVVALETGLVQLWNPVAERLTGLSAAEAVGQPRERVLALGGSRAGDVRELRHRDGSERLVTVATFALSAQAEVLLLQDVTDRLRAEEELRTLLENSPDVVARLDRKGRHVYVNQAVGLVTGIERDRWLGKTHRDMGLEDAFCATWERALEEVFTAGEERAFTFGYPGPDGVRTFQIRLVPEPSGHTALAIAREVTVLEEARQEVARQRQLLDLVVNGLPGSVAYVDAAGRLRYANQEFVARHDLEVPACLDRPVAEVLPAHAASRALALLDEREPWRGYARPDPATGGLRDYIVSPMVDVHGRRAGILTMSYDVSDRVKLERALSEQRALMGRLIEHSPAGLMFVDRHMTVQWANAAHLQMVGRTQEAFVGRRLGENFPGAEEQVEAAMRQVMATRQPRQNRAAELRLRGPEGERLTFWDSVSVAIVGDDGEVDGVLVCSLEVTDRVERERLQKERIAALEDADRLKEQFLAILSHELRTPINAIMGFGSILADALAGPLTPKQERYLALILSSSDHLLSLVDDLLDMSRIQAGTFALDRGAVDAAAMVRDVLAMVAPLVAQKALVLEVALPEDLPVLQADRQRLSQVLVNLVTNAVKFTPSGGKLGVAVSLVGDRLRCSVSDTGPGIPPEHQQRVFERFYQLDMSVTRANGGAGLGLSIARALVEAHGGRIGLDSEVGVGSCFWFELPT